MLDVMLALFVIISDSLSSRANLNRSEFPAQGHGLRTDEYFGTKIGRSRFSSEVSFFGRHSYDEEYGPGELSDSIEEQKQRAAVGIGGFDGHERAKDGNHHGAISAGIAIFGS